MRTRHLLASAALLVSLTGFSTHAQQPSSGNAIEAETIKHFQALIQADTTAKEEGAATYLQQVLEKEGIPVKSLVLDAGRPNIVARLKGSGKKKPLLIMGHTDVVNVDPAKWTHPPFSATREGGYVYGRGAVDDKDNLVAGLMTMLMLKRQNVPLDRDVIFLAEAGEEGATRVGIQFMVGQHYQEIDAEYCLAEGGNVTRQGGQVKFASVQTMEKIPRAIELIARGPSGHGSVPLQSNAIVHLASAVSALGKWRAPVRLNDTTRAYFDRLAGVSSPEEAARYRALIGSDAKAAAAVDDFLAANEARHASMLRTSVSPNIMTGGYRVNVIPSEAKAMLDVRMLPDEDPAKFLDEVRKVINDPAVEVAYAAARRPPRRERPAPRLRGVHDARSGDQDALQHGHTAGDEPRRHRHGVPARQRHAVLRHRPGDRLGRRPERLRLSQRSGAHPRIRAAPLRAVQVRCGTEAGWHGDRVEGCGIPVGHGLVGG